MKRILLTVLAIMLCLTIFSGCNKDSVPGKSLPIILTIAETAPSCPAFESNCFYAFDAEGVLYRVLWTDFTDLNEKDTVVVDYSKKEKLNIPTDVTGGFHAKYEITAISIYSEEEWKAFEQSSSNED